MKEELQIILSQFSILLLYVNILHLPLFEYFQQLQTTVRRTPHLKKHFPKEIGTALYKIGDVFTFLIGLQEEWVPEEENFITNLQLVDFIHPIPSHNWLNVYRG